jgi:cytoskeleton protein RodZ
MADIGPTLREARMRDGRDVSEIEQLTKIRAKYLRALENEEWALLPGPTFTKGFLRSYAEALGLDARQLIDEYKRQWEEPHELDVAVRPSISGEGRDGGGRGGGDGGAWWRSRWAGAAVLIVVLAVAILLIGRGPAKKATPPASSGSTTVLKGSTSPKKSTAPSGTTTVSCAKGHDGEVPAGCVSLRVEPTAAVYVCLRGDHGAVRIPGLTLDPQSRQVTYHARRFVLTLGNTSVKLLINGHLYGVEAGTKPVRYSINDVHRERLATPTHLTCT